MNNTIVFFILQLSSGPAGQGQTSGSSPYFSLMFYTLLLLLIIRTFHRRNPRLWQHLRRLFVSIHPAYKVVLERQFLFYQELPLEKRRLFERRLQLFIDEKIFVAREMPKVSREMKALVAGSAVQISFGLPEIYFKHFTHIILYPDVYYSTISEQHHKGEVNPTAKAIVLSWKHFLEGYEDPHNAINLGLHEMAHALHLENDIYNGEARFLDEPSLKKFEEIAEREIIRIKRGEIDLFRSYAAENMHEFFAVSVELFFEKPRALAGHLPDLYEAMVGLLKQNPLSK